MIIKYLNTKGRKRNILIGLRLAYFFIYKFSLWFSLKTAPVLGLHTHTHGLSLKLCTMPCRSIRALTGGFKRGNKGFSSTKTPSNGIVAQRFSLPLFSGKERALSYFINRYRQKHLKKSPLLSTQAFHGLQHRFFQLKQKPVAHLFDSIYTNTKTAYATV